MRRLTWRVGAAVLAALASSSTAQASLRWDFAKRPETRPNQPTDPAGRAVAVCAASADGSLSDCRLLVDEPADAGVGAMLLNSAPDYRMHPRPKRCAAKLDKVAIALSLPRPDQAVEWLRRPTFEDMYRVYPAEALKRRLHGSVALACDVAPDGRLEACRGLFVDGSSDAGFEHAAEALAPVFQLKPAMKDGQPVRGSVMIPMNFYPVRPPC